MATLKEALIYAGKNPNSEFARKLKLEADSGRLDNEAVRLGIDLTPVKKMSVPIVSPVRPIDPPSKAMGVLGAVGSALISGPKGVGETLGQSWASGDLSKNIQEAQTTRTIAENSLIQAIREKQARGEDVSRELSTLKNSGSTMPKFEEIAPATQKTDLQALAEVGQTGLDVLSGGSLTGVKGFGLASNVAKTAEEANKARQAFRALPLSSKLAKIGLETGKDLAYTLPIGYGYDVTSNLKEGKTGEDVFKPGLGTVAGAIPAVIGGIRATKNIAGSAGEAILPKISSTLTGIPEEAYKVAAKSKLAKATPEMAIESARQSASMFNDATMEAFGNAKKEAVDKFTGIRIGLNNAEQKGLRKVATEFGFEDRLPQNLSNMSVKETFELMAEINKVPRVSQLDHPAVSNAKRALLELKDAIKTDAVKQFGGEGGIFDTAYQNYAKGMKILGDVKGIIGDVRFGKELTPVQLNTAKNRLMKVFNEGKNEYLSAIRTLEQATGENILEKVAVAHFQDVLPRISLKFGSNAIKTLLQTILAPLSSPKVSRWVLSKLSGYSESTISKILNLSPEIRSSIYKAVNEQNMSLDDAIKTYVKDLKEVPRNQGMIKIPFTSKQAVKETENQILGGIEELSSEAEKINKYGKINIDLMSELEDLHAKIIKGPLTTDERLRYNEIAKMLGREDLVPQVTPQISPEAPAQKAINNATPYTTNTKSIPKVSNKTVDDASLLKEAKKYKTAGEFVKARGTPVYHGTSMENANKINTEGFKVGAGKGVSGQASGDFIYATGNKAGANRYVSDRIGIKNPTVIEGGFNGKTLEIQGKMSDFEAFGEASKKLGVPLEIDSQGKPTMLNMPAIKKAMQEQGYGAISFSDRYANGTKAFAILPDNIKTKSQLTDIWNKANKK